MNLVELAVEAIELAGIGEVAAHQVRQLLPFPLPPLPAPCDRVMSNEVRFAHSVGFPLGTCVAAYQVGQLLPLPLPPLLTTLHHYECADYVCRLCVQSAW